MSEYIIPIQTALMPAYYKEFHCLMGACRDNCCGGWDIEFNKKDYLNIKRTPKSKKLEELVSQNIVRLREKGTDARYAEIKSSKAGECAFYNEDGLCALQLECGEAVLPRVCKTFPRLKSITPAGTECSLTPACEGVFYLLWELLDGIEFWEEPLPPQDCGVIKTTNPIYARFADIRAMCIDVLQERSLKLPQRLLLLGFLVQQLRDMDWDSEETVDLWLEKAARLLHDKAVADELDKLPRNRELYLNHNFGRMVSLHRKYSAELTDDLLSALVDFQRVGAAKRPVFNGSRYRELEEQLEELLGHSEYFFENLMVSLAFYRCFPLLETPERLWESYLELCDLYSCYRFAAVCGCAKEVSRERLFFVLVRISRSYLHNRLQQNKFRENRHQDGSDTLAHMAILVGG